MNVVHRMRMKTFELTQDSKFKIFFSFFLGWISKCFFFRSLPKVTLHVLKKWCDDPKFLAIPIQKWKLNRRSTVQKKFMLNFCPRSMIHFILHQRSPVPSLIPLLWDHCSLDSHDFFWLSSLNVCRLYIIWNGDQYAIRVLWHDTTEHNYFIFFWSYDFFLCVFIL